MTNKRQTLEEMVETYAADGLTPDEEIKPGQRSVWVSNMYGSAYLLSPDNYGVTLVIGGHYWGKGEDLDSAKREFKKAGGRLSGGYAVYTFPADTLFLGVNGMGLISWNGPEPSVVEHKPRGGK